MWRVVFPLHKSSHSGDEMSLPARITAEPPAGGGCLFGAFGTDVSLHTPHSDFINPNTNSSSLRSLLKMPRGKSTKIFAEQSFTIYSLSTQKIYNYSLPTLEPQSLKIMQIGFNNGAVMWVAKRCLCRSKFRSVCWVKITKI